MRVEGEEMVRTGSEWFYGCLNIHKLPFVIYIIKGIQARKEGG